MVDTITVPSGSGATPPEPSTLTVTGAGAVPVKTVAVYGDPAAINLDLANAVTGRIRAGAAGNLATVNLANAGGGLTFAELVVPASVDSLNLGAGCAQGDWVDQIIAALPDRSTPGDGEFTDVENILSVAQLGALNAKGFIEA